MNVSEAVAKRISTRAFLNTPLPTDQVMDLVERAARAPSGGNLQPWRIYVVNGPAMGQFKTHLEGHGFEAPGYEIYPPELHEPYRTNRYTVGEQMYALLGIPRDDKTARLTRMAENYNFFGAPCGIFCFTDVRMGKPQWSDLGMYLQTLMLLAEEAGLSTCAQESWTMRSQAVAQFVGAPEDQMLFCGLALGHADPDAPVNTLVAERQPVAEWATVID